MCIWLSCPALLSDVITCDYIEVECFLLVWIDCAKCKEYEICSPYSSGCQTMIYVFLFTKTSKMNCKRREWDTYPILGPRLVVHIAHVRSCVAR